MSLNLLSPVNTLGYGYVGYYLTKHLLLAGHRLSLFPIGKVDVDSQESAHYIKLALKNAETFDATAPSVRIYHQFSLAEHVGKGKHIGFPIFELNRFSKLEKHHIESCDAVFVCSDWAKGIVLSETRQKNVHVVPLGFDPHIANGVLLPPIKRETGAACVFFNCGKLSKNKGHDILCTAFNEAFSPAASVELWMMCDNPFFTEQETRQLKQPYLDSAMGKAGKIRFLPRVQSHAEVIEIMKQADVGVWPFRAEGWNLELLEMMAIGKQVIATKYSGATQFISTDNCFTVQPDGLEPAYDGKWFFGQGDWAKLGDDYLDQLIAHMQYLYEMNEYSRTNYEGIMTGRKFSWENAAKELINGAS
jgi:glycosyltransferase involved in cell wall biosynthesis